MKPQMSPEMLQSLMAAEGSEAPGAELMGPPPGKPVGKPPGKPAGKPKSKPKGTAPAKGYKPNWK